MTAVVGRCDICGGIRLAHDNGEIEETHARSCPRHWSKAEPGPRHLVACSVCEATIDVTGLVDPATRVRGHSREQHPARITGSFRELAA